MIYFTRWRLYTFLQSPNLQSEYLCRAFDFLLAIVSGVPGNLLYLSKDAFASVGLFNANFWGRVVNRKSFVFPENTAKIKLLNINDL